MLTTPIVKDDDMVFPGEGWFLYWKTSASLWKSKIEELHSVSKIYVPINWSFHSDTGERFDFANEKPETDLKKLSDICHELGKDIVFLLPITPAPYLANGGVPFLLARVCSQDENGFTKAYVDSESNINQMYSFFDPRIFTAFTRFCFEMSKYFSRAGIDAPVWGIDCGELKEETFKSYLTDSSSVFEKGFSKFLQAKKEDASFNEVVIDEVKELDLKTEYLEVIYNLYKDAATKELSTYWQGIKKYGFLLGNTSQVIHRSLDNISEITVLDEAISYISLGVCPSSILIPALRKKGIYKSFKNKVLTRDFVEIFFGDSGLSTTYDFCFKSSYLIKIYSDSMKVMSQRHLEESGFLSFCESKFTNNITISDYKDFNWEEELEQKHRVYFFRGIDLDVKRLSGALKMFMNGENIFIDKRALDDSLQRRLEAFYIENNLKIEKLRFHTQIETISIGEGRLFLFDSGDFLEVDNAEDKKNQFWSKVFTSFEVETCQFDGEQGVKYLWFERHVGPNELKFERVKRVNIFNPSSYKKKIKIRYPSSFVFQKIIDEENVQVANANHEIEMTFLPKGSISLDFGVMSK